jgi:uracil-DNA glycosylase
MSLDEYFGDWVETFDLNQLNRTVNCLNILYASNPVVPKYEDIFKAFTLCSKKDCRVVFLGQDPYPQEGVATGILFGNSKDTKDISPSLKVIRDSVMSLGDVNSFDITLESWAKQGILMINSALTCEVNKIGKHFLLWKPFMSKFLLSLSAQKKDVVYVLFGNQAQSFESCINNGNYVLKVKHPAFYARWNAKMPNKIFRDINYYIKGDPIQWYN